MLFVILVTHPKSYIETTDRRHFDGKPSKWRWGQVLSWKIPEFCSVGWFRSKTVFFRVLWYPSIIQRTAYRKQFYPKTIGLRYRWKAETLRYVFCWSGESVTRHLADIGPWRVQKCGNVTIAKMENLHTDTCRKIYRFQKCYSFRSSTKDNVVIAENPFQKSGVTRRLWTLGRHELTLVCNTPSSLHFFETGCHLASLIWSMCYQ